MSLTRFALWLFVITVTGYLMIVGRTLVLPLVLAIVFWYLINTLAETLHKVKIGTIRLPRPVTLPVAIAAIGGLFWLLGTMVTNNIEQVIKVAPTYQARLEKIIVDFAQRWGLEPPANMSDLFARVDLGRTLQDLGATAASIAGSISVVLIYTMFLIAEQATFSKKLDALFKDDVQEKKLRIVLDQVANDIQKYIRIKTVLALITAGVGYIIMRSVGLDFAEFWAVLIFFFYYIPTVGSLLAIISPTLLTLVQFDGFTPFLVVLILMGAMQITMANVVEPWIMGRSLNVSPFIIILSLFVFGTIWGVVGMFLCVPIVVIAIIVLANFPQTRPLAIILSADGNVGPLTGERPAPPEPKKTRKKA